MPGRVVKSAPYSADVVTETTQTLADGNHIRQSSTAKVYRDTEGRTRREQSLNTLGGLAPSSNLPQVVFINDPVAGFNYALNSQNRTATKSAWNRPGRGAQAAQGSSQPMARLRQQSANGSAPGAGRWGRGAAARQNVKTESLGRQTIEGVPATNSPSRSSRNAGTHPICKPWCSPSTPIRAWARPHPNWPTSAAASRRIPCLSRPPITRCRMPATGLDAAAPGKIAP
jgi:hypothetical protein